MSDDPGVRPDLELDEDLGDPIDELRGFEEAAPASFLGRLFGSLRRRQLGSELVTLGWSGIAQVMVEFLRMINSLFQPSRAEEGDKD